MKEYDLYVPLNHNDGTPVDIAHILRLQQQLLDRFGGVTYFPQPNEGFWRTGGVTYRDQIVILRVITDEFPAARAYFRELKERLKATLAQEEILIVERQAHVI